MSGPYNQVRAKVCILGRPSAGVHSSFMEQTYYVDRPEEMG